MRNLTITIRITIITCGILSIFMLSGGFFFTKYQMNLVNSFIENNLEHIYQSVDKREKMTLSPLKKRNL